MFETRKSRRALSAAVLGAVLIAALLAAAAALGSVVKGAKYKGVTGKPGGEAVTFKVASNGKHVLNFTTRLGYNGKCGQGGGPVFTVSAGSIPLSSGGSFTATVTGTLGPFRAKIKISGHITGRKASGAVEQTPPNLCKGPPNPGANAYRATFTASAK